MAYIDIGYYYFSYNGMVCEEDFNRLSSRASAYIDYITQGRAKENADLDAVKMCCCALVDKLAVIDAAQVLAQKRLADAMSGADVKSESVGSYSRTLATGAEGAATALSAAGSAQKLLADTCREYLGNTGLLYRGRRCACTLPTL